MEREGLREENWRRRRAGIVRAEGSREYGTLLLQRNREIGALGEDCELVLRECVSSRA